MLYNSYCKFYNMTGSLAIECSMLNGGCHTLDYFHALFYRFGNPASEGLQVNLFDSVGRYAQSGIVQDKYRLLPIFINLSLDGAESHKRLLVIILTHDYDEHLSRNFWLHHESTELAKASFALGEEHNKLAYLRDMGLETEKISIVTLGEKGHHFFC